MSFTQAALQFAITFYYSNSTNLCTNRQGMEIVLWAQVTEFIKESFKLQPYIINLSYEGMNKRKRTPGTCEHRPRILRGRKFYLNTHIFQLNPVHAHGIEVLKSYRQILIKKCLFNKVNSVICFQLDGFQELKIKLNDTKSKLNDLNLNQWHLHTANTNTAGEVIKQIRYSVYPEFLTQVSYLMIPDQFYTYRYPMQATAVNPFKALRFGITWNVNCEIKLGSLNC